MPVLSSGNVDIDYTDVGEGPVVVLIHSSVSGNRQWGSLTETLKDQYRILAINLYGYGETSPWPSDSQQTLYAQAQLLKALCQELPAQISIVGHSFGGAVVLKTSMLLGPRVQNLILLEPNPFYLLKQVGRVKSYLESLELRDHVKCFGSFGDWMAVAPKFVNYWLGEGTWDAMPEKRRVAFSKSLPPNFHEWDAVMGEETTVEELKTITARSLIVCDSDTVLPIREIVDILIQACPNWHLRKIKGAGHMAPITKPDVINPIIQEFLKMEF